MVCHPGDITIIGPKIAELNVPRVVRLCENQAGYRRLSMVTPFKMPALSCVGLMHTVPIISNAFESLDLHLESLQKLGKRIPKPKHRLVVELVK